MTLKFALAAACLSVSLGFALGLMHEIPDLRMVIVAILIAAFASGLYFADAYNDWGDR